MITFFGRRFDEVDIQPFHQIVSNGGIFQAILWQVKDSKERQTGVQSPVMVSVIGICCDPLGTMVSKIAYSICHDPYRSVYPAFFSKVDIIHRQLPDDTLTVFMLGPCRQYSILNRPDKRIARNMLTGPRRFHVPSL